MATKLFKSQRYRDLQDTVTLKTNHDFEKKKKPGFIGIK